MGQDSGRLPAATDEPNPDARTVVDDAPLYVRLADGVGSGEAEPAIWRPRQRLSGEAPGCPGVTVTRPMR